MAGDLSIAQLRHGLCITIVRKESGMDANIAGLQYEVPLETTVVDADGVDLGKVVETRPGMIVVEKGRIFPTELYIPRAAITSFDGDQVQLAVTKDEARVYRWDQEPGTEAYGDEYIADPFLPSRGSGMSTGAPGNVEDPEGDQLSGPANTPPAERDR
jgi:hypothetical protein